MEVEAGTEPVAIHFTAYGSESDPGPYPIPADAPIEGGPDSDGDRHVIAVDRHDCVLYELFDAHPRPERVLGGGFGRGVPPGQLPASSRRMDIG